jgi:translocation and assembly module TamB
VTRGRIAAISTGVTLAVLAAIAISAVVAVRSGWLREKIRERVVSEAEKATGGVVEIGRFDFDWRSLTATLDGFRIHGTEKGDAAPLLAIDHVVVGMRIISLFERKFDVAAVRLENPRAHVMIEADGMTNLPQPRLSGKNKKSVPQTILDLKIGKFDVSNGLFIVERAGSRDSMSWSGSGQQLALHVNYNADIPRYEAQVLAGPLDVDWGGIKARAEVTGAATFENNRVQIPAATVRTGQSELDLSDVVVNGFTAPVTTGRYRARVALADADRAFHLVNFQHTGYVNAQGDLRLFDRSDYVVNGALRGEGIGYGPVHNMRVTGNVTATPENIRVRSMVVSALGGEIRASGDVRNLESFHLAGRMQKFDARALAALGGIRALPYDGMLAGPFEASGKLQERDLHNLIAGATLEIMPSDGGIPVHGELTAKFRGATNTLELGSSWLALPNSRVDFSGTLGQVLNVRLESQDVKDFAPVVDLGGQRGSVKFEGTVAGNLDAPRVDGHGSVENAVYQGHPIDSVAGNFIATSSGLSATDVALASGALRLRVTGSIGLVNWKPVDASSVDANIQLNNADVSTLLAMAGKKDVPVSGTVTTTARVTGTVSNPRVAADFSLSKGEAYGEPYDSIAGRAQYANGNAETVTALVNAGRKRANVTAKLEQNNRLTFDVSTNAMAINEIALARKEEPSLRGTAQVKADGVVRIETGKPIEIEDLNADVNARGLSFESRALGNAHLVATTKNGLLTAKLDSDVAKSNIHGDGTVRLGGEYPINAKLTFSDLGLSTATALVRGGVSDLNLDGSAAGEVTISGPARKPDALVADFNIAQFEVHPLRISAEARNIANLSLKNTAPIHARLEASTVRLENAHFIAPSTDLSLTGSIALRAQSPLNLQVQGRLNLALAETLNTDLTSAGQLTVNAAVRGTFDKPDLSGRAELQKGDFHLANFSNGLTNANGVILFSGTRATIQSLSAESGGGSVDVTGFAALAGGLSTFRVEAKTTGVRIRYPEGVSTVTDSNLTLAGTSQRSQASGAVTVRRVAINPKSDMSTILAAAAEPLKSPQASDQFLTNLHLDVQIETAPDVAFETSVAQSIAADANLRLRGTAANPAVLGRINITQGELSFFGNKYTINQGTISFFNPARIDPVLNVDLETKARGVDVVLTVTGPINKLNVSYRSDPPLQFSDIVALLATGRTPTDPTLAVRDTGQSQSLQQMGASALIGQAIANPVAGRLQRFFGVSRIKIDPQLTGITGSPEARLTVEQQITPDLLFTYITDVSSTSTQLIRVEWDFNKRWAAILTREENGYVGVDFAFRKRFK